MRPFFCHVFFVTTIIMPESSCPKYHCSYFWPDTLSASLSLNLTFTIYSLSTVVGMKSPSRDIEFQFSQRTINSAVRARCYVKEMECKRCAYQMILFFYHYHIFELFSVTISAYNKCIKKGCGRKAKSDSCLNCWNIGN